MTSVFSKLKVKYVYDPKISFMTVQVNMSVAAVRRWRGYRWSSFKCLIYNAGLKREANCNENEDGRGQRDKQRRGQRLCWFRALNIWLKLFLCERWKNVMIAGVLVFNTRWSRMYMGVLERMENFSWKQALVAKKHETKSRASSHSNETYLFHGDRKNHSTEREEKEVGLIKSQLYPPKWR